jgi:hypothetical protein
MRLLLSHAGSLARGLDWLNQRPERDIRRELLNLPRSNPLSDAGAKHPQPLILLLDAELGLCHLAGDLETGLT